MNILVGQSGGPTAAINASLAGVFARAKEMGAEHIYGMLYGIKGFLENKYVDLYDEIQTDMDIELLKRTPSSYLGSCRYKLPDINDEVFYDTLFQKLKALDISAFFYIGGNDSMDTIHKLSEYGKKKHSDIRFIGIPKTIDNDLLETDHTPGFGSAAKFVATTIKEVNRDALVYDMESVTIVEIMGRNAGWLAGSAVLAGVNGEGADLIYLPEVDFDMDAFIEKVSALVKTKKAILIAVSEGIHDKHGKFICDIGNNTGKDDFGHVQLSGTAAVLASIIKERLGIKARGIELNTIQRAASHIASATDIEESFNIGKYGIEVATSGKSGHMVVLRRVSDSPYIYNLDSFDIGAIANGVKEVPRDFINEDGDFVNNKFIAYVKPLIQGELTQIFVDGLPMHLRRR